MATRSPGDILIDEPHGTPLNERMQIVVCLAGAVLFLHAFNFVHKTIQPENIIIFRGGKARLGKSYLVECEKFRPETTGTHRIGDDLCEKNPYHDPHRQGVRPRKDFLTQCDVYSRGVVLLELGLSMSILQWPSGPCETPMSTPELDLSDLNPQKKSRFGTPNAIAEKLVTCAERELPNGFGQNHTEVVLSCSMCLDRGNDDFGYSRGFEDDGGILIGVQHIENVRKGSWVSQGPS